MSKKAGSIPKREKSKAGTGDGAQALSTRASVVFRRPFAPRPGLFFGLLGLLGIWVAILLTMYFMTVYPQRGRRFTPVVPMMPETVPSGIPRSLGPS